MHFHHGGAVINVTSITACIRRMRQDTVFSVSVHTSTGWRDVTNLANGGGGYFIPGQDMGVPPPQVRTEDTPSKVRTEGAPSQVRMGIPHWQDSCIPHRQHGGTPCQQDGVPPVSRMGVPPRPGHKSGQGGTPNWNSIACTCYTTDGMSHAFTQENFLVCFVSGLKYSSLNLCLFSHIKRFN